MELLPKKPFGDLTSLRNEMDNFLGRFFRESSSTPLAFAQEWFPSVDISESKDKLLIKAELPGMDVKDISVSVSGDVLTIKGEKKREEERKDEHYYCTERFTGAFNRSIKLPVNIKTDEVDATFEKGVLHVSLSKTEETRKKEIEIKVK